jgi:hypothetical protein
MISDSRTVANKVWKTVRKLVKGKLTGKNAPTVYVSGYDNGREHGLHIVRDTGNPSIDTAISFSEYRSSDNIVIYLGGRFDFDNSNVPNENVYASKIFFEYAEIDKAARAIAKWLILGILNK